MILTLPNAPLLCYQPCSKTKQKTQTRQFQVYEQVTVTMSQSTANAPLLQTAVSIHRQGCYKVNVNLLPLLRYLCIKIHLL